MADDNAEIIDWAALVAKLTVDEDRAQQRYREHLVQHLDQWWARTCLGLPDLDFARFGNRAWLLRCNPRVIEAVKKWQPLERVSVDRVKANGLVLCGRTGVGKSTAVLARLHQVARKMRDATAAGTLAVKYPPSIGWVAEKKLVGAAFGDESELQRARRVGLLIIDEFGYAGGDRAQRGRTPAILDVMSERYDRQLPTVVTTGLRRDEIAARYGSAILRRMSTNATVVEVHDEEAK